MGRILEASVMLMLLLCTSILAGCTSDSTMSSSEDTTTEEQKLLPQWEVGDQWLYTFITPQFGEDSARLVVAEIDNES